MAYRLWCSQCICFTMAGWSFISIWCCRDFIICLLAHIFQGLLITAIICILIYCGKNYWNYADDKKDYKKYLAVKTIEEKFKQDNTTRVKKDSVDKTKDSIQLKNMLAKNKLADTIAKKIVTLTKKQVKEKGEWEAIIKSMKYDYAAAVAENKAMRTSSYTRIWTHLMQRSQNKESHWLYRIGLWDIGSPMFPGMALLGFVFFGHRFHHQKTCFLHCLPCLLVLPSPGPGLFACYKKGWLCKIHWQTNSPF